MRIRGSGSSWAALKVLKLHKWPRKIRKNIEMVGKGGLKVVIERMGRRRRVKTMMLEVRGVGVWSKWIILSGIFKE
jgi:hypothetical protein